MHSINAEYRKSTDAVQRNFLSGHKKTKTKLVLKKLKILTIDICAGKKLNVITL